MAAWCRRSPRAPMSSCSIRHHRQALAEAGLGFDAIDAVAATSGPGPDRRPDRRRHHGQGDRAGLGKPLHRGQSSRGACADRRPHRSARFPVSAAARLGRAYPAPGRKDVGAMSGSAPRSTTRWARRSTRRPSCSASVIPAAPRSRLAARAGKPTHQTAAPDARPAASRISRWPASRPRSARGAAARR